MGRLRHGSQPSCVRETQVGPSEWEFQSNNGRLWDDISRPSWLIGAAQGRKKGRLQGLLTGNEGRQVVCRCRDLLETDS